MSTEPATASASPGGSDGRLWHAGGIVAAATVALFAFTPVADWIRGGRSVAWYSASLADWLNGSLIALGAGVVYAIASRRVPSLWRDGALRRPLNWYEEGERRFALGAAIVSLVVYAIVALLVFDGRPLLIDEIVQLLQARIFSEGQLARPTSEYPEFFSALHIIDTGSRYFSQFPAGGPAMYLPGWILGVPWLVNPVCGAVSVGAFALWVRTVERRIAVAFGATLIFALAPFMVFMSASHMNHVPTLMWSVLAMLGLSKIVDSAQPRPAVAFAMGLALGMTATIRPVDGLAFALPAGIWMVLRAVRTRHIPELLASGVGVMLPVALLFWINTRTTGSATLFGYEMLWGPSHGLGFHVAPWGLSHTPARGVELVNLYFLRLQNYLFETPVPSLVPLIGSLALMRRWTSWDRYLLASSLLLVLLYFAYWHDGFYLGPRFLFLMMPVLALMTARFPALVQERWSTGLRYRAIWGAVATSVLIAVAVSIPLRARQYSSGLLTMRWNADDAARRAGVSNAVVLVRESWGAQLVARLWALGVSRSESERLYRGIDACQLDSATADLERTNIRGDRAEAALIPMLRDSARVQSSPFSPDTTEGFRRGVNYTPKCLARINDDRAGFTVMAPLLLARQPDVLYIRDLHARDSLVLERYPDRAVFLLRPSSPEEGALPVFYRVSRDSLYRAWREPLVSPSISGN